MSAVIEISNAIMEVFIVLFFFRQTLERKPLKQLSRFLITFGVISIHIIRSFLPIPTYVNFVITLILWSILLIFLFQDFIVKKITILSVYFIVLIVCDMMTRFIVAFLLEGATYSTQSPMGIQRYIGIAINLFLTFVINSLIALFIRRKHTIMSTKYWIMLLLFPIFSLFIVISTDVLLLLAGVKDIKYIFVLIMIIIGLLYFNIVVFEFIDNYSAKLQLDAANELIKKQAENYNLLEINEKNLRTLKHNINNHMETMKNMLNANKISEPLEFMKSLEELSALDMSIVYTNDATLDAILNIECKKATAQNIKYLVKTQQLKHPLNILPADKSIILCNALDNSIEACAKLDEKFIIIDIASDEHYIKICIENASLPINIRRNLIFTTKKDTYNHGLGLDSIKQTIKKYNGKLNLTYNNGITTCRILMNNPSKQN